MKHSMRRFEDYIFQISQVKHEEIGQHSIYQGTIMQNDFILTDGEAFSLGFLTKSYLNLITINPKLTSATLKKPNNPPALIFNPPEDALFSVAPDEKPADYFSQVECTPNDTVENAYIRIGKNNVEYIFAYTDRCITLKLPKNLVMIN